jgi:hypothetical protein
MKPSKLTLLLLPTLLLSSPAMAQKNETRGYVGDRLVKDCRAAIVDYDSPSKTDIGSDGEHCIGYVQGFIDTALLWQVVAAKTPNAQAPLFCLSSKVTIEVVIRLIPIWALEHPEDIKETSAGFLLSMLVSRYPCSK